MRREIVRGLFRPIFIAEEARNVHVIIFKIINFPLCNFWAKRPLSPWINSIDMRSTWCDYEKKFTYAVGRTDSSEFPSNSCKKYCYLWKWRLIFLTSSVETRSVIKWQKLLHDAVKVRLTFTYNRFLQSYELLSVAII